MTRESCEKITGILRGHPRRIRLVCLFNHTLTGFTFVLYPAFPAAAFLEGQHFFLRALFVPAVSFAAVTVFRRIFNTPRPYEKFGLPPAIEKIRPGNLFPAVMSFRIYHCRHHFLCPPFRRHSARTLRVVLAVLRVIGGVHERTTSSQALLQDSVRRARILCTLAVRHLYFPST